MVILICFRQFVFFFFQWTSQYFISFFKIYLFSLLIFFFLAALGLRCCTWAFLWLRRVGVNLRCGVRASHCGGFSCCGAQALRIQASVVVARGLSSCVSWALEHRLSSCGARAQLLRGMWDLPGSGLEPVFPGLAGRFLTTVQPGKPSILFLKIKSVHYNILNIQKKEITNRVFSFSSYIVKSL